MMKLLRASVTIYVVLIFAATHNEGLSRLTHAALALMLLALGGLATRNRLSVPRDPLFILPLVLLLYAGMSSFWAAHFDIAFTSTASLFFTLLGTSALWIGLWNGLSLRPIALGVMVGFGITGGSAYLEYLQGGDTRAAGLASNPNRLGTQSAVAGLLVIAASRHRSVFAWTFALAAATTGTVLGASRKMIFVWVALAILAFLTFAPSAWRTYRTLAITCVLLPFVLIGSWSFVPALAAPLSDVRFVQRLEHVDLRQEDFGQGARWFLIGEGVRSWAEAPVLGHGQNQFRSMNARGQYAHNNYVELLVNLGLVGLLIYYAQYVIITFRSVRGLRARPVLAQPLLACVLLLLMWEVALVTYTGRLYLTFVAVLAFLSTQIATPRESALTGRGAASAR